MRCFIRRIIYFLLAFNLFYIPALPSQRFVTLKSNVVNLRVGPGMQYPIKATYECRNMPLLVIDERDSWIMVKDIDNEEGWVHASGTRGARFAIAKHKTQLHRLPKQNSRVVSIVERGLIMQVKKCTQDWCLLYNADIKGWVLKTNIWGISKDEIFGRGL